MEKRSDEVKSRDQLSAKTFEGDANKRLVLGT